METSALLRKFPDQKAATIRQDFTNFYKTALTYLEKWYDFTDDNYQKHVSSLALRNRFKFSHLSDAVEVLQIGGKLDMDELYEEYCATLPRQQEIVERRVPVLEKWSLLLKGTKTPNLTAVASFLFGIPVTNASVERVFSLMGAAWTDQRNRCSVELIKSEIQVKTNFEYTCKEFYSYALKEKTLLEAARSSKKATQMKCDTFKEYKKKLHEGEVRFRMRFPAKLRIETCEGERAFDCPQKARTFIDAMQ
ncbi:hypothetical protein PAMA_011144 [Pampus argenteus]